MMLYTAFLAVFVGVLSSGSASAGAQSLFRTVDGRVVEGWLVLDDGENIKVRLKTNGPGTAVLRLKYSDLRPRTIYNLKLKKSSRDDAATQLELADLARKSGLMPAARKHFESALRADDRLHSQVDKGLALVRRSEAYELLEAARRKVMQGDVTSAVRLLARLTRTFPKEHAAAEGERFRAEIAPLIRAALKSATDADLEREGESSRRALSQADGHHVKGVRLARKGLLLGRHKGAAVAYHKASLEECRRARRRLGQILSSHPQDRQIIELAQKIDDAAREHMVQTRLHLASLYLVRQSYNRALMWANQAIADDPNHKEAKTMRARIEIAASSYGWSRGWSHRPAR